ncbi:hypothetical protein OQX63_05930 [Pedobacter sp. PF22-3]|uniref:hypothetical protein n=1 Tax=Pedobacter sp. PF22-3 TaxID=2994467 RepID=UPI0022460A7C|nr:hypothetical protein [Pedobacter sp. PF22-3]MCX2493001.1 hypothetical protein [Pedobacter sp. PF22-3]
MENSFTEIYGRDAWGTVRGFVYQVDFTINRWLNLNEDQHLELECGEDIDVVCNDIITKKQSRELEQFKYRESEISLNRAETLEILKNFFIHRKNNPNINLIFRFVTNTQYTIERKELFGDGTKGIDAWIDLHQRKNLDPADSRLQIIKTHLIRKAKEQIVEKTDELKPAEIIAQQEWIDFSAFLEDDQNVIRFIQGFEWSFSNEDHVELANTLHKKLCDQHGEAKARLIYSRLFLFVFKLLSQRELKSLTKQDLLDQYQLPQISSIDLELFNQIIGLLSVVHTKIQEIENKVEGNTQNIATLFTDLNAIKKDAIFEFRLNNVAIDAPEPIINGSSRSLKVTTIKSFFELHSWINFYGINGCGKSQMAALVCREYENYHWLDMREFNQFYDKSALLLEAFLLSISGQVIQHNRQSWIVQVLAQLPKGTILVLNDLPELRTDEPAFQHLVNTLALSCQHCGIKLLTTCNYKIPNNLVGALTSNNFHEYTDFTFTDQEIIDLLDNNKIVKQTELFVSLIAIKSSRNPRLVLAMVQYLGSKGRENEYQTVLESLSEDGFAGDVIEDIQRSVLRYVDDQQSRELLYRLSLMNWAFGMTEVKAVSTVETVISSPAEKLQVLLNVWVQPEDNRKYQVSPLAYNLGENNLAATTIQHANVAIADAILSKKKVNQITATRAIFAYIRGKDTDSAVSLLYNVLQKAQEISAMENIDKWGFLKFWVGTDLPEGTAVSLQTVLINEQIRIFKALGRDLTPFFEKIKRLSKNRDLTVSEAVIVRLMAVTHAIDTNFRDTFDYLEYIISHYHELPIELKEGISPDLFIALLWVPIKDLKTFEEIQQWLNLSEKFKDTFNLFLFENEIAEDAISLLCDSIINQTATSENQKEQTLAILYDFFEKHHDQILKALVIKRQVQLAFWKNKDRVRAVKLTFDELGSTNNNVGRYLLHENLGKLFHRSGDLTNAYQWLSEALKFQCGEQINYTDTLIYAAASISGTNPSKAIHYCLEAVSVAENRIDFHEIDYIMMLGELAVSYWVNKQYNKVFETFEMVVCRLFAAKIHPVNERWIKPFLLTGHMTGYIAGTLSEGRIPQIDGDDFFPPYQGVYLFYEGNLTDKYEPKNDAIVFAHLATISEILGKLKSAYEYSLKAFDVARKDSDQNIFYMISTSCAQYSIVYYKPRPAFEAYLYNAVIASHLHGSPAEKYDQIQNLDLKQIFQTKATEEWKSGEQTAISFAILSLVIRLLLAYIQQDTDREDMRKQFMEMLEDYLPDAVDNVTFEVIQEIVTKIITNKISTTELIQRGNVFSGHGKQALHNLCILGVIFLSNNRKEQITQLINGIPYLHNLFRTNSQSIIRHVLVPFVSAICLPVLKAEFFGNKEEMVELDKIFQKTDNLDPHLIQAMIRATIDQFEEFEVIESRKAWLFRNEFI